MSLHILLDSYPLGLLSKPTNSPLVLNIGVLSRIMITAGHHIYIPEVIDYELRRELIRANKMNSIKELENLRASFRYLPITTEVMLLNADLWAYSRRSGIPTGDPAKLVIDVILSAQALTLPVPPASIIVATSNVPHISRFVSADLWTNINP